MSVLIIPTEELDVMDELKERRDEKHREQAYVNLAPLDMPKEIADLTFDYLKAYRDTMVTHPEARKQVIDLEKLAFISNPIDLIDITLEQPGKWTFSVEGIKLFSILTDREYYPGTFDIHGVWLPDRQAKTVKWAEEFTTRVFGEWLAWNTNQSRDPSEFSVPLAMVAYIVAYLAMRATDYREINPPSYFSTDKYLEFTMDRARETQLITLHLLTDYWKP